MTADITNIKLVASNQGGPIPNKGVEISYKETNKIAGKMTVEGNVEVGYEYHDIAGDIYAEVVVTHAEDKRLLAKMPLAGLRSVKFIY